MVISFRFLRQLQGWKWIWRVSRIVLSIHEISPGCNFWSSTKISEIINKYLRSQIGQTVRSRAISTLLRDGETSRLCSWISWQGEITSQNTALWGTLQANDWPKFLYQDSRFYQAPHQHGRNDLRPAIQALGPHDSNHVHGCAIGQDQLTSLVRQEAGSAWDEKNFAYCTCEIREWKEVGAWTIIQPDQRKIQNWRGGAGTVCPSSQGKLWEPRSSCSRLHRTEKTINQDLQNLDPRTSRNWLD